MSPDLDHRDRGEQHHERDHGHQIAARRIVPVMNRRNGTGKASSQIVRAVSRRAAIAMPRIASIAAGQPAVSSSSIHP